MSRRGPCVVGALLAWLSLALQVQAQVLGTGVLPVTEVGPNLFQSTITAVQSTLTALSTAQSAANSILDLTPLDEMILASGIIEAAAQLADIMAQIEVLDNDVQSLAAADHGALWFRDRARVHLRVAGTAGRDSPAALAVLQLRDAAANADQNGPPHHPACVHTGEQHWHIFGRQAGHANPDTGRRHRRIRRLTILAAQTAAFQRAASVDKMEELLTIESLQRIQEAQMADWPKRR